jgi:hypothetical protein
MERTMDNAIGGREGISPVERALRVALVVYLSPVLVVVLAIAIVGMLASRIGKPIARAVVEGVHAAHRHTGPIGFMKRNRSARRIASATARASRESRSNSRQR